MPQEDYFIRQLQKLAQVVGAMFGLRGKGFVEESIRLADEAYTELLHLSAEELSLLSDNEFAELIENQNHSAPHLEALAGLTHETAKAFDAKNDAQSAESFYRKTLQTYYLLNKKDKTFSFERERIIEELKAPSNSPEGGGFGKCKK